MFGPWLFEDSKAGRNYDNTVRASMICLDFDDDSGWTVEDAKQVFAIVQPSDER